MSRSLILLAGASLALASSLVPAQSSVPVIERSGSDPAVSRPAAVPGIQPVQAPAQTSQLAELLMTIDQLQEEVRYLRGRVEEQGHEIKQMRTDQRDRYRDLDRRISMLTKRLGEMSPAPQAALAPLIETPVSAPALAPLPVSSGAGVSVSDSEAYRRAFAHVRQREFDRALTAFADFERTYGSSELLGNVFYWTGEVYRAKPQPDQQQARQAYQRLLDRFPNHPKAPEATYKLGLTYDAQGDRAKAQELMQLVISRYPEQQPARLARDFLSQN